MEVDIQSVGFSVDQKLVGFINEKIERLTHFYDRIVFAEVFLKVDRKSAQQNKIVEIKLGLPRKELFSKKQCDTFEEAAVEAVEASRRQLTKHKGKVLA